MCVYIYTHTDIYIENIYTYVHMYINICVSKSLHAFWIYFLVICKVLSALQPAITNPISSTVTL